MAYCAECSSSTSPPQRGSPTAPHRDRDRDPADHLAVHSFRSIHGVHNVFVELIVSNIASCGVMPVSSGENETDRRRHRQKFYVYLRVGTLKLRFYVQRRACLTGKRTRRNGYLCERTLATWRTPAINNFQVAPKT